MGTGAFSPPLLYTYISPEEQFKKYTCFSRKSRSRPCLRTTSKVLHFFFRWFMQYEYTYISEAIRPHITCIVVIDPVGLKMGADGTHS